MNDRRYFIKQAGVMLSLGAALPTLAQANKTAPPPSRLAMVIDPNRCMGCQSCIISCKAQNDTAPQQFNTTIQTSERTDHHPRAIFIPKQCNQCEQPLCVAACPAEATFKLDNGIVIIDWNKCISCHQCISACPYNARHIDNRFSNKVDKCDFCLHRLEKGLQPACVESCSANARLFGNKLRPEGEFKTYLETQQLHYAKEELKIKSAVHYTSIKAKGGAAL